MSQYKATQSSLRLDNKINSQYVLYNMTPKITLPHKQFMTMATVACTIILMNTPNMNTEDTMSSKHVPTSLLKGGGGEGGAPLMLGWQVVTPTGPALKSVNNVIKSTATEPLQVT